MTHRQIVTVYMDSPLPITGMQAQAVMGSIIRMAQEEVRNNLDDCTTADQRAGAAFVLDTTFTVAAISTTPDEQIVHHLQALGWYRIPSGKIIHKSNRGAVGYDTWTEVAKACITTASE